MNRNCLKDYMTRTLYHKKPFIAIADFIHERRTIKKGGERNENNESC